jgi:hypothetical protein
MRAIKKVHHKERMAIFGADRGKTKVYPENIEANLEETEPKAEHWEVPYKARKGTQRL